MKARLLLVEDDPERDMFIRDGYEVTWATTGVEGCHPAHEAWSTAEKISAGFRERRSSRFADRKELIWKWVISARLYGRKMA